MTPKSLRKLASTAQVILGLITKCIMSYILYSDDLHVRLQHYSVCMINQAIPYTAVDGGGKSFTSLEELLNITGINTPTGSRPDNGVSSLSRIAQAVENSQNGESS